MSIIFNWSILVPGTVPGQKVGKKKRKEKEEKRKKEKQRKKEEEQELKGNRGKNEEGS